MRERGVIVTLLAYVVDEARSVPVLDDFHRPHPAPSVQGEALAPARNAVRMDPFADAHGAPEVHRGTEGRDRQRRCEW